MNEYILKSPTHPVKVTQIELFPMQCCGWREVFGIEDVDNPETILAAVFFGMFDIRRRAGGYIFTECLTNPDVSLKTGSFRNLKPETELILPRLKEIIVDKIKIGTFEEIGNGNLWNPNENHLVNTCVWWFTHAEAKKIEKFYINQVTWPRTTVRKAKYCVDSGDVIKRNVTLPSKQLGKPYEARRCRVFL